jgi:hypothetical protein
VQNVGIGKIETLMVEFVLTDLDVFYGFSHDGLVHYICRDLFDQVAVLLLDGRGLDCWKFMYCKHRAVAFRAVFARR